MKIQIFNIEYRNFVENFMFRNTNSIEINFAIKLKDIKILILSNLNLLECKLKIFWASILNFIFENN